MPLVLGPLIVGLLPFLAALVLIGLSKANTSAHGSSDTGSFFDFITGKQYLHSLSGFAAKFARWIVSRFAAGQLVMLARWFTGMGTLTIGWFTGNVLFAEAIVHAIERVVHRGDPKARSKASTANRHAVHAGHAAAHANTHARSVGHALDRYKARTNPRIAHATHAVDVAIPHDIGALRRRTRAVEDAQAKERGAVADLEHGAAKTWDWIKSHPLSAVTAAFTGAVVVALSRLGYGFLRCRSWRRLGRSLTCNDANILRDLFALATVALASEVSIVEFVRFMQSIEDEALSEIHSFIRD